MAIDARKPFASGKVDTSANQVECEGETSEAFTHREALKLNKVTKKPHTKTSGRFPTNESDEIRSAMIVAIELFDEWTILSAI
ncbi:MAG: hypothetical protein USCAAHI_02798 [Beijerinckiaceae bacterium]|nr:MAG: hypothetical protein USCAAHI_02798 [Beijerinckiaceae bacterium]